MDTQQARSPLGCLRKDTGHGLIQFRILDFSILSVSQGPRQGSCWAGVRALCRRLRCSCPCWCCPHPLPRRGRRCGARSPTDSEGDALRRKLAPSPTHPNSSVGLIKNHGIACLILTDIPTLAIKTFSALAGVGGVSSRKAGGR